MASTFEFITKTTAGSDTAAIDFSSFTQAYEHLEIRIAAISTYTGGPSDDCRISFNRSGTMGTWDQQIVIGQYGTDSVAEIFSTYGQVWMPRLAANWAGAAAGQRGVVIIHVNDYANTSKKASLRWYGGTVEATQATQNKYISFGGAVWSETTAISEIRIQSGSASLKSGTTVAIYGIKSS